MKIFEKGQSGLWEHRINFVDDNNVFVGFDYYANCYEEFGYFLSDTEPVPGTKSEEIDGKDFQGFNFDTDYRKANLYPDSDEGGSMTFRLVNANKEEMFLTIYNFHNGYYSHGWEMKESEDGEKLDEGYL